MDTLSFDVDSFFASSQEIKREDMGVPDVHSPEEPLSSKRKGTFNIPVLHWAFN